MRLILLAFLVCSCIPAAPQIEVTCQPPKVLEDAFVSCLTEVSSLNEKLFKANDDAAYYKNRDCASSYDDF